jgi:hypothetical protein
MKVVSIKKGNATSHRAIKAEITIDWPARGEVTYCKWAAGWTGEVDCSAAMEKELNKILKAAA